MDSPNADLVADAGGQPRFEHEGEGVIVRGSIRLRHPLECLPYRPARKPGWIPTRDRRDAGLRRHGRDEGLVAPRLEAAPNLGAVRVNFRYGGWVSVSAMHSDKAQRDQYFESSNEPWGARLNEVDTQDLDLQYQPITVHARTRAGKPRRIVLDFCVEKVGGKLVFGEDKASSEYFEEPETYERLAFVESHLETYGVGFERRVAGGLKNDLHRAVVKEIFDNRRTLFEDREADAVRDFVRSAGGIAALGDVLRTLGHPVDDALAMIHAMMRRRLVAVPLDRPAMPDTPVTIPVVAEKGALRAFLAEHIPEPETAVDQ